MCYLYRRLYPDALSTCFFWPRFRFRTPTRGPRRLRRLPAPCRTANSVLLAAHAMRNISNPGARGSTTICLTPDSNGQKIPNLDSYPGMQIRLRKAEVEADKARLSMACELYHFLMTAEDDAIDSNLASAALATPSAKPTPVPPRPELTRITVRWRTPRSALASALPSVCPQAR